MTHKSTSPDSPIKLTLLGTGTTRSRDGRACASILLESPESTVLVDCGPGSWLRLNELQRDLNTLDSIFLTHFHPDHASDLVPILFTRFHASPPSVHPVKIWGAPGIKPLYRKLSEAFGDWMNNPMFHIIEIETRALNIPNFQVFCFPLNHSPESTGYRFEDQKRSISISGDTGPCPELIQLCHHADLAILECSFPDDRPDEHHLTPSQAGLIAQQAGIKKLVLSHFYPEVLREDIRLQTTRHFSGELQLGADGDSILI